MAHLEIVANQRALSEKLALIGYPVTHSKSPALFRAAYPSTAFTYELIEAETLEKAMERFFRGGFSGANITAPYKDDIFQYITHPDKVSSLLRSANIILRRPGGELHSYNSDYYGVKETVRQVLSGELGNTFRQKTVKTALVTGAGGAGKAAALALRDLGIRVFLANRTPEKAMQFAQILCQETGQYLSGNTTHTSALPPCTGISLAQIPEYLPECDLIIHALSIPLPELSMPALKNKIVFEANYGHPHLAPIPGGDNNLYTYISGKYWLYNQAIPAFQLFTGLEPDTTGMWKVF